MLSKELDIAHVALSDHSTYDARQIWAYPDEDIAVLDQRPEQTPSHPHRDPHDLKVGQVSPMRWATRLASTRR